MRTFLQLYTISFKSSGMLVETVYSIGSTHFLRPRQKLQTPKISQ